MAQIINTNMLALMTQNNLNKSQSSLSTAVQRLSSGLRINSAKDDAAGQAIANRFTANINGLGQASRNANDGTSIAQTTEGALNQINDNLQNIRRLVVQAQNGTNSASDKKSIQEEITERLAEINRTAQQTDFNGVKVLASDQKITIQVGADDGQTISINLKELDSKTMGMDGFNVDGIDESSLNDVTSLDETVKPDVSKITDLGADGKSKATELDKGSDGNYYVKADDGKYYKADVGTDGTVTVSTDNKAKAADVDAGDLTTVDQVSDGNKIDTSTLKGLDKGAQLVSNKDADGNTQYFEKLTDQKGNVSYKSVTIDTLKGDGNTAKVGDSVDVATKDPLKLIDSALSQVGALRSDLGAIQNRFDSVTSNISSTTLNLTDSRSHIEDADYAAEASAMTQANVIQQAGISVLAQANQQPNLTLKLLG